MPQPTSLSVWRDVGSDETTASLICQKGRVTDISSCVSEEKHSRAGNDEQGRPAAIRLSSFESLLMSPMHPSVTWPHQLNTSVLSFPHPPQMLLTPPSVSEPLHFERSNTSRFLEDCAIESRATSEMRHSLSDNSLRLSINDIIMTPSSPTSVLLRSTLSRLLHKVDANKTI
eukprot:CAMPEP_0172005246 /NCGR_PEP_ID=MMETSP1041-20130122/4937_1 /TAXON_ID=464988 /ORGANISM="Hemiselmis andersenii, Strain CCMP439" /LENGTH=171 /DNA_ID=CAMNT_0012659213 /DNA_START=749 /DNA_END=1264 /DNA_ORIENTATION=-